LEERSRKTLSKGGTKNFALTVSINGQKELKGGKFVPKKGV